MNISEIIENFEKEKKVILEKSSPKAFGESELYIDMLKEHYKGRLKVKKDNKNYYLTLN